MSTDDSTTLTGTKIDYYTILKRRKRNAESFVADSGIVTVEGLNCILDALSVEYLISDEFRKATFEALAKSRGPVPAPVGISEIVEDVPAQVIDADDVQKPKRRSKKED